MVTTSNTLSENPTGNDEWWTANYLIDVLKKHLAMVKQSIENRKDGNKRIFDSRKYYDQAHHLLKIGAFKPAIPYVIYLSDLTPMLLKELFELNRDSRDYVLRQAVGRIFEDVNSNIYHNSVSRPKSEVRKMSDVDLHCDEDNDKTSYIEKLKEELAGGVYGPSSEGATATTIEQNDHDDKYDNRSDSGNTEIGNAVAATELESKVPNKDYAEFVIKLVKKTVKQEDALVRQIFYTGLSAYTNDPINLGIIAPTSEGKTYPVIETLKHFPKEDVWLIGSMSTKLLVRQKGVLVDENNILLKPKIREIKEKLEEYTKDKKKQQELKEQLQELYENARILIDLRCKILVFLEPPQHDLWNLLKPILSHDSEEIEFPYVDKTDRGLEPKRVIVKGWPACIFCSGRDESNWPVWPEIQSRFLITSPNMNSTKYYESNILISQRKSLPGLVQQRIIMSDEEIELAKKCVLYLKQEIQKFMTSSTTSTTTTLSMTKSGNNNNNNNPVWIPYGQILAEILPSEKGTDTRTTKRIFSLLQIIPLAKAHLRHKLIFGAETLVIAALEDLKEVLHITQNISGMPAYKLKFFKEIFLPLYRLKSCPDKEVVEGSDNFGRQENRTAVTTKQLCDYLKEKEGKTVTTNNLKKTYLNELLNNGYIDEEDSVIDKRQKIYYPLIEFPSPKEEVQRGEEEQQKKELHNFRESG